MQQYLCDKNLFQRECLAINVCEFISVLLLGDEMKGNKSYIKESERVKEKEDIND